MPPIQYWFTGSALATLVALLTSMSMLSFTWYRSAVTEAESASNKIESAAQWAKTDFVKGLLGKALVSGNELIQAQQNKDDHQAEVDANEWSNQTQRLIAAAYGDGEAALFLDSSGYVFYGDGSPKSDIRNWIDGRMRRVTELLRRTDSLTVRNEFDVMGIPAPDRTVP
jgi:hypothetical protein